MVLAWPCSMESWNKVGAMKWKKCGKIFDPTQHDLPNDCVQFAQSPQVLVFDDFVRIYFSTRAVDKGNGKYLSHIAFVEMQKNFCTVIRVSNRPVIPLGALGCFDERVREFLQRGRTVGFVDDLAALEAKLAAGD